MRCHEGRAVVVVGLFEAVFELLNSMLAVEAFGGGVDDVGSVVERSFEIGGGVGLALCECGAVAAIKKTKQIQL